jgi:hypothetical protein
MSSGAECPLLAHSGDGNLFGEPLLSTAKQTSVIQTSMSANDQLSNVACCYQDCVTPSLKRRQSATIGGCPRLGYQEYDVKQPTS